MDLRFMSKVQPLRMYGMTMLHIIIPKKTTDFYNLKQIFLIPQDAFITVTTKEDIEKESIIEASDVENIIKMQKKGELISKKIKLKLRRTYDTAKNIHEYAQEHKDFKEPEWVKALFNEPDALDRAIERVVQKARLKEKEQEKIK